jgi:uncharacterized protein HemX
MMKASILGGAAIAILILLGAGAYAVETKPPDKASDAEVATPQRKSPKNLMEKGEKLLKTAEKKKAADEEKLEKQEKQEQKAKVDKIQRKTGRTPTSWQVLNR